MAAGGHLNSEDPAVSQAVLQPFWRREAAVADLPVEGQCDAKAACVKVDTSAIMAVKSLERFQGY